MRHLSLSDLTCLVKEAIEDRFVEPYWVVAEVSELNEHIQSGHCYMELIEKDEVKNGLKARCRAIIWGMQYRMIKPYFLSQTGRAPAKGMKLLLKVHITFHQQYGFSLTVQDIDPTYTLGEIAHKRAEIIRSLTEDGVLNMNKELSPPFVVQRIAVISSKTAAGWGDFKDQLLKNRYGFRFSVELFSATMQGEQTERSVIDALDKIFDVADQFDVVVIIRGGGSQADLGCFDSYNLAYHITQFPLPVITGIGHERDDTVVDMVSFKKMKTPTAVATMLVEEVEDFAMILEEIKDKLTHETEELVESQKQRIKSLTESLITMARNLFKEKIMIHERLSIHLSSFVQSHMKDATLRLKEMTNMLREYPVRQIRNEDVALGTTHQRLTIITRQIFGNEKHKHEILQTQLEFLHPKNILNRGFSITMAGGKLVKKGRQVSEGEVLTTITSKGEISSKVISS